MTGELQACPKCGVQLQRRLADIECPACGWFKPARGKAGARSAADATAAVAKAVGSSRLQVAVDPPPGYNAGQGAYRGLLHSYERAAIDPLSRWKLLLLTCGGGLFVAGNLMLPFVIPGVSISPAMLATILFGSLIGVGIAAGALYVDWAAPKLIVAILALGFIGLDIWQSIPLWVKFAALVKVKHVVDAIVLLVFAILLLIDWRRESQPVEA